ncbi:hypothetical protein HFRIS_001714 [Herbaspirillum frisingense GSF30]|uniref:Uncharacterized protein n=1 Tax=Herbaspirillum frisingense GSF30 TaxID=864073 RepID=A0AAI9IHW7_9BURK|nr:hypothetical protein [Herbaspirillum frisingense]EOA06436.1 hypothetical protein HFRIS_001714 [Herbaspirillum frisingense GSF30]
MEATNAFRLEYPRLMKALLALITFSTVTSMVGLIGPRLDLLVFINFLVLVVTLVVPWWHYSSPSCIGEALVKILSVVQGIAGAWYMAASLEPILFGVPGPGKWLALLLAQLFNLAFSWMFFKAATVCRIESGAQATMEWLKDLPKDR